MIPKTLSQPVSATLGFIQTFEEVQEPDGNFHEPVFNFEGDAIGYFGSAIADTAYIEITR